MLSIAWLSSLRIFLRWSRPRGFLSRALRLFGARRLLLLAALTTIVARTWFFQGLVIAIIARAFLSLRPFNVGPGIVAPTASFSRLIGCNVVVVVIIVVITIIVVLIVVIDGVADIGEVEECMLWFADVDEGSVHSLNDPLDLSEEDRTDAGFLVGHFEKDLRQAVILENRDAHF